MASFNVANFGGGVVLGALALLLIDKFILWRSKRSWLRLRGR